MAGRIAYYGGIVTNGLVLCLDAGKPDSYNRIGTTWRDISGNGNNGTLTNGPTFSSANGGSIVFDGTDDYVSGFDSVSINSGLPFTFEFWFNLTSYSDAYPTLLQIKTNTTYSCNFIISQVNSYDGIAFGSSNSWVTIKTSNIPTTNTWNHSVITYNGSGAQSNSNFSIFLNSVSQTISTSGPFNTTNQSNYIGTANAASRGIDDFIGNISVVRIYNQAFTATQVLQNYNAQKSRFGL